MTSIVRKETRKRGLFGIIFRILFYAFNLFMAVWVAMLWHLMSSAIDQYPITGTAGIGVGLAGTGMIAIAWLLGDAILGALVLMTRAARVIVEERVRN